jgi:phage baseplate assembly protein W
MTISSPLIGFPLLPTPNTNGELAYPSLEDSVRQSIRLILSTRPGEQLMHPTFGAGLSNYVHEPNTLTTRRRIQDAITQSLEQYERRILIERVEVNEVPNEPSHIRVEIAYRLRRTGAAGALGITLILD